jgi:hypothetical protein
MSREEEYRRLAQDCLRLAQIIQNREVRTALQGMAREWQKLADEQQASLSPDDTEE